MIHQYENKLGLMTYLSAAMLIARIVAGLNILSAKTVLAVSSTSETANRFGQSASQLAQGTLPILPGEQMGKHSASQQGGGEQTDPRLGIGNVGNALCGERLTLSPTRQPNCP